jgi:hypothetical protein
VVFADQAATPARKKRKTPPESKANYRRAFFDSIGQKAKYSLRADVFRFTPNNGHAVTAPP